MLIVSVIYLGAALICTVLVVIVINDMDLSMWIMKMNVRDIKRIAFIGIRRSFNRMERFYNVYYYD